MKLLQIIQKLIKTIWNNRFKIAAGAKQLIEIMHIVRNSLDNNQYWNIRQTLVDMGYSPYLVDKIIQHLDNFFGAANKVEAIWHSLPDSTKNSILHKVASCQLSAEYKIKESAADMVVQAEYIG